ncbi:hypothetical protein [Flectobacillus rivi]|uniref:Uncharacterized protein n=1 Tax=Flectobacillus rivi TaxID=2984209 RepID=A0ABT6YYY9_9BACT|nr:hypothetical protein [Flectobacillus rivi]MDI9874095.1 hypothetical protein [Flectobacillus rivi]
MKKNIIITLMTMAITIFCFYKLGSLFSPGSYPYAEVYEMDISSPLLIGNIKKFRTNNPTFDISSKIGLTDSFIGEGNDWIMCYFYYEKENQIVATWVRGVDRKHCQFALVSLNDGIELGKWKDVNHDYGFFDSIKQRNKFEERILKPLGVNYKRRSFF